MTDKANMTNAELEEMALAFKANAILEALIQLDRIRNKYPLTVIEKEAISEAIEYMFEKKAELATWFKENTKQLGEVRDD